MLLRRAKTRNGNYLVFQVDEQGEPIGKGCYATPEGALMERTKRTAKTERDRVKENWDNYEEEPVPHEVYTLHAQLFSEKPQERSFGSGEKNNPFAGLGDLLKVGDNH